MDEMEKYRNKIERRNGDRRMKNDRREFPRHQVPKFFDWEFVMNLVFMVLLAVAFIVAVR